jgi:hypothetical protein
MSVHIAVSDLFFNAEKSDLSIYPVSKDSVDYEKLVIDANRFLETLAYICSVDLPSTEELVDDYIARI